jgi:hypothetical protein
VCGKAAALVQPRAVACTMMHHQLGDQTSAIRQNVVKLSQLILELSRDQGLDSCHSMTCLSENIDAAN